MGSPILSIVVPFYNEQGNVRKLYEALTSCLKSKISESYEIIFVDDGSLDGTSQILYEIQQSDPNVIVIKLAKNYGQTRALLAGFEHTKGEFIVPMDGDLQDNPDELPKLLNKLKEGYDIVSGWRKERADNLWLRRIPSKIANKLIARIMGVNLHDFGCTFKVYRRKVIEDIELFGESHRFIPAVVSWKGFRITEVPVAHTTRESGRSKYNLSRIPKVLFDLLSIKFLTDYLHRPLHFLGRIGLLFFLAGFGIALAIAWFFYFGDLKIINHVGNLILAALLMILGVQFFAIGLVLEVCVRIYFRVSGRKMYSIETILKH